LSSQRRIFPEPWDLCHRIHKQNQTTMLASTCSIVYGTGTGRLQGEKIAWTEKAKCCGTLRPRCGGLDDCTCCTAPTSLSHQLGPHTTLKNYSACSLAHIGRSMQCPPMNFKTPIPSRCSVPLVPCTAFSRKVSSHDEQTLLGQTDPWCTHRAITCAT
jgi:hypothetical protein